MRYDVPFGVLLRPKYADQSSPGVGLSAVREGLIVDVVGRFVLFQGAVGDHLVESLVHVAGFGGNSHAGAAVGGNGLVDGQYICAGIGKNRQVVAQHAGIVLQQGVKRDNASRFQILKRLHGVLIFIKRAAADVHASGRLAHGLRLAHLQHPLRLGDLNKNIRQRVL